MRKKLLIAIITVSILSFIATVNVFAGNGTIYIAEPIQGKIGIDKTVISLFNADGTKLREIYVNGIMAKVSPNGKYIVYLEDKENGPRELALADSEGNKLRNLPTLFRNKKPEQKIGTINLEWSPDGEKIIVLQQAYDVFLSVLYLKNNDLTEIHSLGPAESSEEPYLYTFKWFPDSARILISNSRQTKIVDINSKPSIEIAKKSAVIDITRDGKKVVYIPGVEKSLFGGISLGKPPYEIWQYDVEKQRSEKLISLDALPSAYALSHEGKYLAFLNVQNREPETFIADLTRKTVEKLDTKAHTLIPIEFSSNANNLIVCTRTDKKGDKAFYGVFNVKNGEFKQLKEPVTMSGEASMGYFLFTWIDWR